MNDQPFNVAACVLAAGQSSRMGKENKLLSTLNDKTLLQHVLSSIQSSIINDVIVITGCESEKVVHSITQFQANIFYNENFSAGLSTSIYRGVENLGKDIDAVVFFLSDMPFVSSATINEIVTALKKKGDIVVPTFAGHDGNPVLWSRRYFNELKALQGDYGAKSLLTRYPDQVRRIEVNNIGIVLDIDDAISLEFFRSKFN